MIVLLNMFYINFNKHVCPHAMIEKVEARGRYVKNTHSLSVHEWNDW